MPTEARNEFSGSGYIRPVFRDRDTLTAGVLNDELRSHLEASKYLVVICSPHSAQSQWVSDEVKAFIEMGRLDRIVPFIIEGSPKNYDVADFRQPLMGECFPLALRQWNSEHPDRNLLGIAVTDDGIYRPRESFHSPGCSSARHRIRHFVATTQTICTPPHCGTVGVCSHCVVADLLVHDSSESECHHQG